MMPGTRYDGKRNGSGVAGRINLEEFRRTSQERLPGFKKRLKQRSLPYIR